MAGGHITSISHATWQSTGLKEKGDVLSWGAPTGFPVIWERRVLWGVKLLDLRSL